MFREFGRSAYKKTSKWPSNLNKNRILNLNIPKKQTANYQRTAMLKTSLLSLNDAHTFICILPHNPTTISWNKHCDTAML